LLLHGHQREGIYAVKLSISQIFLHVLVSYIGEASLFCYDIKHRFVVVQLMIWS